MAQISEHITISAPPAQVWAALAQFDRISTWAPNVDHSSMTTEQSEGVGAQRRVQVGRMALLEQVTEWRPAERLGYTIAGLPPVVRSMSNSWRLEPAGSAATDVTLTTVVGTGPRPPQRAAGQVIARQMAKASRQMLDGLKTHIEDSP